MSDAMILVAGAAVGLADSRVLVQDSWEYFVVATSSLLASLSFACLLLRLRQPRPPLHQLINQPGTSACLAGGSPSAFLHILAFWDGPRFIGYLAAAAFLGSFAVAAVWVVQIIGNEMQPEAGWVDRLGVAIGCCWVVLFVTLCILNF